MSEEMGAEMKYKSLFPKVRYAFHILSTVYSLAFWFFLSTFQKTPIFHILFHCLKQSFRTFRLRYCILSLTSTLLFHSRNPASEAIPRIQLPRSLDEITQLHSLMGVSLSCMGKHSSVPSTSQCPERASKVVLRKDARLSFPGEKVPGKKGGRGTCEES